MSTKVTPRHALIEPAPEAPRAAAWWRRSAAAAALSLAVGVGGLTASPALADESVPQPVQAVGDGASDGQASAPEGTGNATSDEASAAPDSGGNTDGSDGSDEQAPADEAPVEETPADEAPVEETLVDEAPAETPTASPAPSGSASTAPTQATTSTTTTTPTTTSGSTKASSAKATPTTASSTKRTTKSGSSSVKRTWRSTSSSSSASTASRSSSGSSSGSSATSDSATVSPITGEVSLPLTPGTYRLSAQFGATGSWSRYHTGMDFAAPTGTAVYSVVDGTVLASSAGSWAGNHVIIRATDGSTTVYAHLSSKSVRPGDTVQAGQHIGDVGSTGRSFGSHLHFEYHPAGASPSDPYTATDPRTWLAGLGLEP